MTTEVGQSFCSGWPLSDGDEPQEVSVSSQMHDRGSVSFGRFSVESLSWERKSVFGHNRRQEELEKFNGLVAKKKAYFEERYRRMRALKAAQPNQQTELILDYGDGSNSSQSGEEDEKGPKIVGHRDNYTASDKDAKPEAAVELESSCSGSQQERKPDREASFSGLSSSEERPANVEQDKNDCGIIEPATMDSSSQMRENAEEGEPNHRNSSESRVILRKPANLESNSKLGAAAKVSGFKRESSHVNQLGSLKKSQGHRSVPKSKDSVTGTRRGPGLKQETKSDIVKPLKGAVNPLRRTGVKAEHSHLTRSTNDSKVNNSTSSALASKRPVAEARTERSNLVTRGAFSIAMEKRANFRGSEVKQDSRSPNKVVSSLSHAKSGLAFQFSQDMSSKKMSTLAIKNTRGIESKRGSKEGRMKPPTSDNQKNFKRTEQPLHVPKSRSVNLPARNRSGSTAGIALHSTVVKGARKKEEKEVTRSREVQGVAARPSLHLTPSTTAIPSAQKAQQSHSARKQQLDNLSLNGRKTKQEEPQWR